MIVGVLKEIKKYEHRVALHPSGVDSMVRRGHKVLVEHNAGLPSGFEDGDYKAVGATIINTAEEIYAKAEMVMKVKEPQPVEYPLMRKGQLIFTYFHFASSLELTQAVIASKATAIAYETVLGHNNTLPLLTPMSEVAGRMSIQQGAKYLQKEHGGRGILLGGVPGVDCGVVMVIGGGVVGVNAAKMAAGLGARVYILDTNLDRLRDLSSTMPANVTTIASNAYNIQKYLKEADLVVSGVLIHGAKAPKLVTREMLKMMKKGSVIVDVAIDQGGSLETSKPTTHDEPVYVEEGVIHYCVTNMPGAVPSTSTIALTNATLPYALKIAELGKGAFQERGLAAGVNIIDGQVTHSGVASAFDLPYVPLERVLSSCGPKCCHDH